MFIKNYKSIARIALVLICIVTSFSVKSVHASVQLKNKSEYIGAHPNISALDSGTPTYNWHTFFQSGELQDSAVDAEGNFYMVGYSGAWEGPNSTPPINGHQGAADIVVIKLNNQGTYQWHTFLGSSENDFGNGITTDSDGNIYLAGQSSASWNGANNTPPLNGFAGGEDMVIVKLNSEGIYQWHTFFGTPIIAEGSGDNANDISIDTDGNVYIVGGSEDTWNGPGSAAPKNNTGDYGITVIRLATNGTYQWHTFYGSDSFASSVSTDDAGNVYITGYSENWIGPSSQLPLHAYAGGDFGDFILLKLDPAGEYGWHTFYGSNNNFDFGLGIDIDAGGNIYI